MLLSGDYVWILGSDEPLGVSGETVSDTMINIVTLGAIILSKLPFVIMAH